MPLVFDDDSSSAGGHLVFDDEQVAPTSPTGQDKSWIDSVSEFGLDLGLRAAGAMVGGVAAMPLGMEKGIKAGVRGAVTGGAETVMPGSVYMPGVDSGEAVYGPESDRDKNARALAGERAASAVPSIPFSQTISDFGTKAREKIHGAASPETQQAVANSQITGNLFKGEIDFGKDPSVRGFVMQASDVFGSMLPVVATALITKNPNAGAVVGGSMAAGEGANSAQDFIAKKTDAELQAQSPFFAKMREAGASPAEARQLTMDKASESAAALQGLVASFGDRFTGKLVTGQLDGLISKAAGKSATGKVIAGGFLSGGEEGFQELSEGVASDVGISSAVPSKEIGEDSAANFVLGALGGGPAGSARGAYSAWRDSSGKETQITPPAQPVTPGQGAGGSQPTQAAPIQQTAAEKALATPVQLTSLDRVNEIDQNAGELQTRLTELNDPASGYGPMFDQERQELATKSQELATEKQALTKDWPAAVQGNASSFSTEAGARVEAKYALMDAADLVTSHDESLRQNPAYPQELQPRARDRAASEMQVSGIVQKLDPARLGLSADAANGAPIVGADGLVESGNARTIALKRVYQANGQKAADYKQFLRDNAGQFGITPESVDAMAKPVLVRIRTTPVNRAEFARQANASTVAMMSPSEQAKSDSARIDSMEDLSPDDSGDFSNAASQPFIRRFMARLPATEQAGMIDASGALSTSGYARVRNAVLAKAYGDSPVLARMTESMDDNLRNVSRALMLAAPKVAQMRDAVKGGNRFDADITPDLMSAVEELSRLKDAGTSVQDALAQAGMFGDKYSSETRALLQFLADNARRPRRMADFILAYMDALDAAGDPNQGSLLGDVQAPAKQDLLKAAERITQDATQDTQRGKPGEDQKTGEKAGIRPPDAPGGEGRTQGNGPAGRDTRLSRQPDSKQVGEPSEWVNFPKDSGTIGIPRADMPQIKGDHRGALIQFLAARGIAHKTEDIQAADLKPTQAEFSTKKAAKWSAVRDGVDRSVLVSSDNHILDGHHQWVAALAANEPIKAIVLDAPIRELMTNVFQFPSVKQSDGATTEVDGARVAAREDFKQAMAELADLVANRLGLRVAMMPSGDPKLHKILVRLFDAAIRAVGTDLKAATRWVKAQLKGDAEAKPYWNKITDKDYQGAALAALEAQAKTHVDDLFSAAAQSQADLFANEPAAPKVAMIDGRAYDYAQKGGDNFETPATRSFIPAEVLSKARDQIDRLHKTASPVQISPEDRARAEKILTPLIERADAAKVDYDQKIIDIAKSTGALGQMLTTVKSLDSSTRKLVNEVAFDTSRMYDMLRSTIVVSQYSDAQAVLDAIRAQFDVMPGRIKNMTDAKIDGATGKFLDSGYGQVLINVKLDGGVIAEIQINVPEMLAVKLAEGHALYEIERAEKEGSQARADAVALQGEIYPLAAAAAVARKDASEEELDPAESGKSRNGVKYIKPVDSSNPNTLPSGNLTNSVASPLVANEQPGGKTSGTFINTSNKSIIDKKTENGYSQPNLFGDRDGNDTDGAGSDQRQGAPVAPAAAGKRKAQSVRKGSGGPDTDEGVNLGWDFLQDGDYAAGAAMGMIPNADPMYLSRGTGGAMDLKALKALAYRIRSNMPNMPDVHVYASPADLPESAKGLRAYIMEQGAMHDVEGAMHKGDLYLFASGLSDPLRAEHVLAEHEAAHVGLRAVLGGSLKTTMLMIYNNNASIRQLATELQKRGKLSNAAATEEAIVDIPSASLVKLKGWRKLVVSTRDWLESHGYEAMAAKLGNWLDGTLNDQQRADLFVADLVRGAREYIAGKREGRIVKSGTMLSGSLAEDIARQEKWLQREAQARGYQDIDELVDKNYPLFEKLATLWRQKNPAEDGVLLSRAKPAPLQGTPAERADKIIQTAAGTAKPIDAIARTLTRVTGIERMTGAIYKRAAFLLDQFTPETVKAGLVSDYGVPDAVIDQRAMMQGRQRVQLRQAGNLIDKLSTLTRAESRVAYEWMNETDPHTIYTMMQNLPDESVKVLQDVQAMIDKLSKEAVRMGQLSPEAYERNKFAYLRRSYAKYTLDQTPGEKASRARAISILGDQYKGRGLSELANMKQIQNAAPEWWTRKFVPGQADTSLKGERLVRLERHAPSGQKTMPLAGMQGKQLGKLQEVHYFPAGEKLPAKYADWTQAAEFEVRDTKGGNLVLWRDFTKDERETMGEIDESRFAIAKTLQGMVHDVEVGRYLEWLAHNYAKKEGETIPGVVVEASEKYRDTFKPGEWVRVPDSKLSGTSVLKYGKLAGRYLEGPVWNDLRQTVGGQFRPFGDTYAKILSAWKTAKTALSPAVHTNNIMSNFVMADWHDVTAGHTAKALRILLSAHAKDGKGLLGGAGNKMASLIGAADSAASREIVNRYLDSGGDIGSWATNEIGNKQIEPLLEALEKELAATGNQSAQAQVGVYHALQLAIKMQLPSAWEALKGSSTGKVVGTEAGSLIDLYQSEDEVFRLASWLKAKEEGRSDMDAGKIARKSFMDYSINAPWVQALRNSALPFISYTYRAVPMMLETAAKKPHKLLKLMAFAGALNAFGVMLAGGGGDDDEKARKLLPEEKAGRVWGLVPKLIRMPWNDDNGSPVYMDIRRFIPVGDVFDVGAGHTSIPILPMMQIGGPLAIIGELYANKSNFTGKPITLETDTGTQKTIKVMDYLYKAFMPNIIGLPGTYATTGVVNAATGKTDAFGREQSVAQAMASSFGVKLGSYPVDVLRKNTQGAAQAQLMEIDKNITSLKRQRQMNGISDSEFQSKVKTEQEKKMDVMKELAEKMN